MIRVRIHREASAGWIVEVVETDPLPRFLVARHVYASWSAARDAAADVAWLLG